MNPVAADATKPAIAISIERSERTRSTTELASWVAIESAGGATVAAGASGTAAGTGAGAATGMAAGSVFGASGGGG